MFITLDGLYKPDDEITILAPRSSAVIKEKREERGEKEDDHDDEEDDDDEGIIMYHLEIDPPKNEEEEEEANSDDANGINTDNFSHEIFEVLATSKERLMYFLQVKITHNHMEMIIDTVINDLNEKHQNDLVAVVYKVVNNQIFANTKNIADIVSEETYRKEFKIKSSIYYDPISETWV